MWKTIGQNYDGPALRGVRFLLAALAVGSSLGLTARFKRHFNAVERVIGLLVLTGVTFITGGVQKTSVWLQQLPGFVDRALNRKRNAERKTNFGASPPPCAGSIESTC